MTTTPHTLHATSVHQTAKKAMSRKDAAAAKAAAAKRAREEEEEATLVGEEDLEFFESNPVRSTLPSLLPPGCRSGHPKRCSWLDLQPLLTRVFASTVIMLRSRSYFHGCIRPPP